MPVIVLSLRCELLQSCLYINFISHFECEPRNAAGLLFIAISNFGLKFDSKDPKQADL